VSGFHARRGAGSGREGRGSLQGWERVGREGRGGLDRLLVGRAHSKCTGHESGRARWTGAVRAVRGTAVVALPKLQPVPLASA